MGIITKISRSSNFEKQIDRIPEYLQRKLQFWVFLVETKGIHEIQKILGFHDEPLRGDRKGQRSVRLNRSYRVIYEVIKDRIQIHLIEVHKHEY